MIAEHLTQASYLLAATLFILSLRWLNHPSTARRGVAAGVAGMTAAIVGTLLHPGLGYTWIVAAMIVGTVIGVPLSQVPLTADHRYDRVRPPGAAGAWRESRELCRCRDLTNRGLA